MTIALLLGSALGLLPATAPRIPEPVESRRIVVAPAETLAVQLVGTPRADDPAIVILPGPIGSAYSMRKLSSALARAGHQVLVIDPLGMGASARPQRADYSLGAQGRRITTALGQLLPARQARVLVGVGTSATIALHAAAESDTSQLQGIVSVAGGVVNRQGTAGIRWALALAPLLDTRLGRAFGRRRFAASARAQSQNPDWVTDEAVDAYLASVEADLRGTLRAFKAMSDAVEPTPIELRLTAIAAPVQMLVGDKPLSNAPTTEQIAIMVQRLRRFRVDTLRASGTMLHEERAPEIVQVIESLVRRRSAGSARTIQMALEL